MHKTIFSVEKQSLIVDILFLDLLFLSIIKLIKTIEKESKIMKLKRSISRSIVTFWVLTMLCLPITACSKSTPKGDQPVTKSDNKKENTLDSISITYSNYLFW